MSFSCKMADVEEEQVRKSCAFFLKRKNRFCRMTVGEGRKYCGEHMIVAGEAEVCGRRRIPCPLDKNHTVFEDQLKRHLKKCNQTKKTLVVYYKANINSGMLNYEFSSSEKVSLSSVSEEKITALIRKIKECYQVNAPKILEETLSHSIFEEEFSAVQDKPVVLKHLKQQASLIGYMDRLHLLEPNMVFMEFGAGKGKLSHWLQKALGNSAENVEFLLIDRANNRYKYDRYHRGREQGPSFQRLNLDIEHLDLSKVPVIDNGSRKIVAFSKHLCGAATDLTLRCLLETLNHSDGSHDRLNENTKHNAHDRVTKRVKVEASEGPLKGIILALCCHHRCSWPKYVGRPFLQRLGFTAEDFHLLCCLSSWATCGMTHRKSAEEKNADDVEDDGECYVEHDIAEDTLFGRERHRAKNCEVDGQYKEKDRWCQWTAAEREEIGRQCKRLIDAGRLWYLESRNFNAKLSFYVDTSVSVENCVLIAKPRT